LHSQLKRDDLVAQLVEQYTFNVWALGSSPSGITEIKNKALRSNIRRALFLIHRKIRLIFFNADSKKLLRSCFTVDAELVFLFPIYILKATVSRGF
jgi:hypothetical protein